MKQAIRGKVTLDNDITIRWLRFVDATTREEAEIEAIRIVIAQHIHVQRCWIIM